MNALLCLCLIETAHRPQRTRPKAAKICCALVGSSAASTKRQSHRTRPRMRACRPTAVRRPRLTKGRRLQPLQPRPPPPMPRQERIHQTCLLLFSPQRRQSRRRVSRSWLERLRPQPTRKSCGTSFAARTCPTPCRLRSCESSWESVQQRGVGSICARLNHPLACSISC